MTKEYLCKRGRSLVDQLHRLCEDFSVEIEGAIKSKNLEEINKNKTRGFISLQLSKLSETVEELKNYD